MGLDPNNDDYPEGNENPTCVDELFQGVTPNCVLAIVQGIEACDWVPIPPFSIPNGAYYLPQDGALTWSKIIGPGQVIGWTLLGGISRMVITQEPAVWFFAEVMSPCHDAFANTRDCELHATYGTGGYVTIWWGPQMCRPPCE